jgi:hypothetical protein
MRCNVDGLFDRLTGLGALAIIFGHRAMCEHLGPDHDLEEMRTATVNDARKRSITPTPINSAP